MPNTWARYMVGDLQVLLVHLLFRLHPNLWILFISLPTVVSYRPNQIHNLDLLCHFGCQYFFQGPVSRMYLFSDTKF